MMRSIGCQRRAIKIRSIGRARSPVRAVFHRIGVQRTARPTPARTRNITLNIAFNGFRSGIESLAWPQALGAALQPRLRSEWPL